MRTYLSITEAGSPTASTLRCAARNAMPMPRLDVSVKDESIVLGEQRGNHQWKPFVSSEPPM